MWIVVGVVAWMAVAALVGVLIGRIVRVRDRQVPRDIVPRDIVPRDVGDLPPTGLDEAPPPVAGPARPRRS